MKYLLLLLLLISCRVNDCRVDPNAIVQTKAEVKTDTKITDVKSESKTVIDQVLELKDGLHPGAQLKCRF